MCKEVTVRLNNDVYKFVKPKASKTEIATKKIIQLYFSSMFARRMPYLLLGENTNEWIYTNVEPESILVYKPSIVDNVHFVNFKQEEPLSTFQTVFPILKDCVVIIELNKFFSVFNKVPLSYLALEIDEKHILNLVVSIPEHKVNLYPCGELTSASIINKFLDLKQKTINESENCVDIKIDMNDIDKSNISFVQAPDTVLNPGENLKIPLLDGVTNICTSEYGKKSKTVNNLNMYLWRELNVVYAYVLLENEYLSGMSIRPLMKWFPSRH